MGSSDLPVFRKADGDDGQLNLQIDNDAAFHTTLHWLRVDNHGRCTQTTVEACHVGASGRAAARRINDQ